MEIKTPATIGPGEFFPVVGVGPHEKPWPTGDQYDPELLENGDRRNVLDKYRYWSVEAIVADLNTKRHGLQIAIENWQHDLNIGSVVRTANAFNVGAVHIVGKRDWNKRGAMVTDRYLTVIHHPTIADFANWCSENNLPIIGIDNVPPQRTARILRDGLAGRHSTAPCAETETAIDPAGPCQGSGGHERARLEAAPAFDRALVCVGERKLAHDLFL